MRKNNKDLYNNTDYKKAWNLLKDNLKGFVPYYLYKRIEELMQKCLKENNKK